jgi:hypothetical protein
VRNGDNNEDETVANWTVDCVSGPEDRVSRCEPNTCVYVCMRVRVGIYVYVCVCIYYAYILLRISWPVRQEMEKVIKEVRISLATHYISRHVRQATLPFSQNPSNLLYVATLCAMHVIV